MQLNIMTSDGKKPVEVIAEFDYMDYKFFVHEDNKKICITEKSCGQRCAVMETLDLNKVQDKLEQNMKRATFDKFELMVKNAIDKWGKAN